MARRRRRSTAGPRVIHRGGFGEVGATNKSLAKLVPYSRKDMPNPKTFSVAGEAGLSHSMGAGPIPPYGIPGRGLAKRKRRR